MNLRIKKKKQRQDLEKTLNQKLMELTNLQNQIAAADNEIDSLKRALKGKQSTLNQLQQLQQKFNSINFVFKDNQGWKGIDVSQEVGTKKYTTGQKNYIRALKFIENAVGTAASYLKSQYGSDHFEELANQYYVKELSSYSQEELNQIEEALPLEDYIKRENLDVELEHYATDVEVEHAVEHSDAIKYSDFELKPE